MFHIVHKLLYFFQYKLYSPHDRLGTLNTLTKFEKKNKKFVYFHFYHSFKIKFSFSYNQLVKKKKRLKKIFNSDSTNKNKNCSRNQSFKIQNSPLKKKNLRFLKKK